MVSMKQSGRISIVMLGSIFSLVIIAFIFIFGMKESLASVGGRFMTALQTHNVDELTKMSMMKGLTQDQIRKEWDQTVHVAGKYYMFVYKIEGAAESSETLGSVKVRLVKDADHPGAYDELVELPMVKDGSSWKVDVRSMSHELFPGLPR